MLRTIITMERERQLRHQRETICMQKKHAVENGICVYSNQQEAAMEIIGNFQAGKLCVALVAQPGTGKTGTAEEVIRIMTTHPSDDVCMRTDNICIITGMNDTAWKIQFESKLLPAFRQNIYHRGVLKKQIPKISSIRNGMIISDECHIASEKSMTISSMLSSSGLTDCCTLRDRKVYLLDISATTESVGYDLKSWGNSAAVVRLLPGPSYKGFSVMLSEDRIRQAPELTAESSLDLVHFFDSRYAMTTKKYFPMRVKPTSMNHMHIAMAECGWTWIHHDSTTDHNIDEMMKTPPNKHTIIFLKDFWRASKRIERTHVGGSYETVPKIMNFTSTSQGLTGRFCDNYEYAGTEINPDLRPIHYCDREAIEGYVKWFDEGCDYRTTDYSSNRINSRNGRVTSIASKSHPSNMQHLEAVVIHDDTRRIPVVVSITQIQLNEFKDIQHQHVQLVENVKIMLSEKLGTNQLYDEFLKVVRETKCTVHTIPGRTEIGRSYEKGITEVVTAFEKKRVKKCLPANGVEDRYKTETCWQVYIDSELAHPRLCCLWHVFPMVLIPAVAD